MKVTLFRPRIRGRLGSYYLKWKEPIWDEGERRVVTRERRVSARTEDKARAQQLQRSIAASNHDKTFNLQTRPALTPSRAYEIFEATTIRARSTMMQYRLCWNLFFLHCGHTALSQVKPVDALAWQKSLAATWRPGTTNRNMVCCRTVWARLLELGEVEGSNPFSSYRNLKSAPLPTRYLAWPDVERLIAAALSLGKNHHLLVVLCAYGGLRRNEAVRARWHHVDWAKKRLFVNGTKNEASRAKIHLHPDLESALLPYRGMAEGWQDDYMLCPGASFVTEAGYRCNVQKMWDEVRDEVGLEPRPRLHDLRHSLACRLMAQGFGLPQIARVLRHGSIKSTQRYADLRSLDVEIEFSLKDYHP